LVLEVLMVSAPGAWGPPGQIQKDLPTWRTRPAARQGPL